MNQTLNDEFSKIVKGQYNFELAKKKPNECIPFKDTTPIFEFFDRQSKEDKKSLIEHCKDPAFLKALSKRLGETYPNTEHGELLKTLYDTIEKYGYTKELQTEIKDAFKEGQNKIATTGSANPVAAVEGQPQFGYLTLETLIATYKQHASFPKNIEEIFGSSSSPKQLDEVLNNLREIAKKHPDSASAKTLNSLYIPLEDPRQQASKPKEGPTNSM